MSFRKFIGAERRKSGTYVACTYTDGTCVKIDELAKNLNLGDRIKKSNYHSTILYSRAQIAEKDQPNFSPSWTFNAKRYQTFDNGSVLAVVLAAPQLKELHRELLKAGGTHDYPDYTPHVSIFYKVTPDLDLNKLPLPEFSFKVKDVYSEPIDLNWNDK